MTALSGIRVVELAGERVAWAGKLLADMGADVILVEPPGGDVCRTYPPFLEDQPGEERSLFWWHYHTSKRGVVLDLGDPSHRARFVSLARSADVLLEGEPRMRLRDLGIDYDTLSSDHPGLVHAAVTPFGRDDPKSDLPMTDLTLMAGAGPPWSCGYDDHTLPPVRGGGNQGYATGGHYAFMSILTALLHRGVTGNGQFIDVSLHAANNVTTEAASYSWLVARKTVQRQTGRHAAVSPSSDTQVVCADGRYVNTGVPPRFPDEFERLHAWFVDLGLTVEFPESVFLEMGARWEGPFDLSKLGEDDTMTAIFAAGRDALVFLASRLSAYDFFIGCQRVGLSVGVIYSPEEAFEDPHFKARGFQTEVRHEDLDRTVKYPGAPYRFEKTPWRISRRAPRLGEHTEEVFAELNRS